MTTTLTRTTHCVGEADTTVQKLALRDVPEKLVGTRLEDFETLYRENLPTVYRYATARLGRSNGEEVASEVFHAAAQAIRRGQADSVTPAWLMAVTKNKVVDHWRRADRRGRLDHIVTPRASELVAPSAEHEVSAQWSEVMETLERLTPRYRMLLMLRYVDDLTVPEIARRIDLSESATESALARARRAFRSEFEEAAGL